MRKFYLDTNDLKHGFSGYIHQIFLFRLPLIVILLFYAYFAYFGFFLISRES